MRIEADVVSAFRAARAGVEIYEAVFRVGISFSEKSLLVLGLFRVLAFDDLSAFFVFCYRFRRLPLHGYLDNALSTVSVREV